MFNLVPTIIFLLLIALDMTCSANNIITTVAGTGTGGFNGDGILATSAQLMFPVGVFVFSNGDLYISDWFNQRIRRVDSSTQLITTVAGTGTSGFNGDGILATSANLNNNYGISV